MTSHKMHKGFRSVFGDFRSSELFEIEVHLFISLYEFIDLVDLLLKCLNISRLSFVD